MKKYIGSNNTTFETLFHRRHGKHHKGKTHITMQDAIDMFYKRFHNIPKEQAQDEAHAIIGAIFFCCIIYGNIWLAILMAVLYIPVKHARRAQMKLEKVYMGPEIVRPALPARATVVPEAHPGVIHYVPAPVFDLEASNTGRIIVASNQIV
jgi:hypothetical protein